MTTPSLDVGSKIRAYRTKNRISLNELSKMTGIAASNLSSIELNKSSPTLNTLVRIARAFNMRPGAFLDEVLFQKATACAKGTGKQIKTGLSGCSISILTDGVQQNLMDARIVNLKPRSGALVLRAAPGDRFICGLEGEVIATVESKTFQIRAGDGLYLLPDTEASLRNRGKAKASALVVSTSENRWSE